MVKLHKKNVLKNNVKNNEINSKLKMSKHAESK